MLLAWSHKEFSFAEASTYRIDRRRRQAEASTSRTSPAVAEAHHTRYSSTHGGRSKHNRRTCGCGWRWRWRRGSRWQEAQEEGQAQGPAPHPRRTAPIAQPRDAHHHRALRPLGFERSDVVGVHHFSHGKRTKVVSEEGQRQRWWWCEHRVVVSGRHGRSGGERCRTGPIVPNDVGVERCRTALGICVQPPSDRHGDESPDEALRGQSGEEADQKVAAGRWQWWCWWRRSQCRRQRWWCIGPALEQLRPYRTQGRAGWGVPRSGGEQPQPVGAVGRWILRSQ